MEKIHLCPKRATDAPAAPVTTLNALTLPIVSVTNKKPPLPQILELIPLRNICELSSEKVNSLTINDGPNKPVSKWKPVLYDKLLLSIMRETAAYCP